MLTEIKGVLSVPVTTGKRIISTATCSFELIAEVIVVVNAGKTNLVDVTR